jgi:hypothetical protein
MKILNELWLSILSVLRRSKLVSELSGKRVTHVIKGWAIAGPKGRYFAW